MHAGMCLVISDSLQYHELQHTRPPCPSLSPRLCSNSWPLCRWYHSTISLSVIPFSCLQSFPASVFSKKLALRIRWPKYWNYSFSISPSNEYSGLISFRIDWFDLLAVQRTLKSLLQHHNSKASILQCSVFFVVFFMLSHLYMIAGKFITVIIPTFVSKVKCLLFNMLSRLVIAFLPRRKHLLILWLQSLFTVILKSKKIKTVTVPIFSPSICHEMMGLDAMILFFEC